MRYICLVITVLTLIIHLQHKRASCKLGNWFRTSLVILRKVHIRYFVFFLLINCIDMIRSESILIELYNP